MSLSFTLACALIAMAAFALACRKHHFRVFGTAPARRAVRLWRLAGVAATTAAGFAASAAHPPGIAAVVWLALLSLAVPAVAVALALWPTPPPTSGE